ncbi:hypothetical protein ACTXT7_005368 [Hymenolepis weldensis]
MSVYVYVSYRLKGPNDRDKQVHMTEVKGVEESLHLKIAMRSNVQARAQILTHQVLWRLVVRVHLVGVFSPIRHYDDVLFLVVNP